MITESRNTHKIDQVISSYSHDLNTKLNAHSRAIALMSRKRTPGRYVQVEECISILSCTDAGANEGLKYIGINLIKLIRQLRESVEDACETWR